MIVRASVITQGPTPKAHSIMRFSPMELLSNLVFEGFGSCGDLAWVLGFDSVFECDASDDFGEVVKAA